MSESSKPKPTDTTQWLWWQQLGQLKCAETQPTLRRELRLQENVWPYSGTPADRWWDPHLLSPSIVLCHSYNLWHLIHLPKENTFSWKWHHRAFAFHQKSQNWKWLTNVMDFSLQKWYIHDFIIWWLNALSLNVFWYYLSVHVENSGVVMKNSGPGAKTSGSDWTTVVQKRGCDYYPLFALVSWSIKWQ